MRIFLKKDSATFYIFLLALTIIIYYIINIFSYFNLPDLCYMGMEKDVLGGNKETIHKAIDLLRKKDKESYKNLCKYVDDISEKYCLAYDLRVESKNDNARQPGCYVSGSKKIYIKPEKEESDAIIEKRAEEIEKFMLMSKNFWENYKKD